MAEIKPYNTAQQKKAEVEQMFDNIAGSYDLLNRVLSFGIDTLWRRKMIRMLKTAKPERILDVATGTGDVAIEIARIINPQQIIGLDLSEKMIAEGNQKMKRLGLDKQIELVKGDSENLPFSNETFDAVTVAFGVRNFGDLERGLSEFYRVICAGGQVAILEFSKPRSVIFGSLYNLYFSKILPLIGRFTSGDMRAYTYLYESVQHFPDGQAFISHLERAGFSEIKETRLFSGICTIYSGKK